MKPSDELGGGGGTPREPPRAARGRSPAGHVGLRPCLCLKGWFSTLPRVLSFPEGQGRSRARGWREFFPGGAGRGGPRCPPAEQPRPPLPAESLAPPAAFLLLLLLPGLLSSRMSRLCHPPPPRSPRPGAGLPGRAGGGAPRSPARMCPPPPRLEKGTFSLRSQQGEFPGTLPPSAGCPEWSRLTGRGKKRWEGARDPQHVPSSRRRGILTGGKLLASKANATSPPCRCPEHGEGGAPGATAAQRGPPVLPGGHGGAWVGWSEGSREGEPSAHGNSQLGVGPPPRPELLRVLPRGEGTPLSPQTRGQSEGVSGGGRSVSQAPVTQRDRAGGTPESAALAGRGGKWLR